MSRIDELVERLCPDGVEYKPLGEIGSFVRGSGLQKKDLANSGFPAIHYGQIHTHYGVWTDEAISFVDPAFARKLRKAEPGDLLIATTSEDDQAVAKSVAWLGSTEVAISGDSFAYHHTLDPKFVSYYFQSAEFQDQKKLRITGTKVRRISASALSMIRVPVPPLEIQTEIVRVLDRLTSLERELETELEAELEARRVQGDHYVRHVLSPSDRWEQFSLGEVCEIFDGPHATPRKTDTGPWYLSISSLKNGRVDLSSSSHLSVGDYPQWVRRVEPRPGDTLFSYETRIGQAGFWRSTEKAALGRRMGVLRPNPDIVSPKFLTMAYLGPQFQDVVRINTVRGSTVDRIPIAQMCRWPMFLPPISEQERIVGLIDRFDMLANDLNRGLPAEISARRQQYEYYRDRLLTFKEKAS